MSIKISIITPSFNQAQYLEETILSVINQNYPNLEYIIIDGGSTDNSVEIIKKYKKYISYWVSEKDSGQSEAINKGLKKAGGEIVAWLNSDDQYCANTLQTVATHFETNKDTSVVYGDVINFDEKGKEYTVVNNFELKDFFSRVSIHQPAVFWRRSVHSEIGYLKENLFYCMDYDLWMNLFLNYSSFRYNGVFARFREHSSSKTGNRPIGLYEEYQEIVSGFFHSLQSSIWKLKLAAAGIDHWKGGKEFLIKNNYSDSLIGELFEIYLNKCLEIEYSKRNFIGVNCLILRNPKLLMRKKGLLIFLKTYSLYIYLRKRN